MRSGLVLGPVVLVVACSFGPAFVEGCLAAESWQPVAGAPEIELLDFYADWCAPCRMQQPVINSLEARLRGKVKVSRIDVERRPDLSRRYGVNALPTLVLLKNGRVVRSITGFQGESELLAFIQGR